MPSDMPRTPGRALATATLTGLVLASCSEHRPPAASPIPVRVAAAVQRDVPLELAATGTADPIQTVTVQSQVSGMLARVAFTEGDDVRAGQLLFQIDARPYDAALARSQALLARDRVQLGNALTDAARYDSLAARQFVTTQQRDQVRTAAAALQATVAADEASVEQARLDLQNTTITAPISGRAGSLLVREGNLVRGGSGQPLVTINQIHPIDVRFAVPSSYLSAVQRSRSGGIPVEASATDGASPSRGELVFIDNAVDSTTGTVMLKARFSNRDDALWPGEFVRVQATVGVDRAVLVVPAGAVVSGQQGDYVFVVQADSTAEARPVQVRRTTADLALLDGGIAVGDVVVIDGQLRLRDGVRVQVTPPPRRPARRGNRDHRGALHPPAGHDDPGHGRHPHLRPGGLPTAPPVSDLPSVDFPTIAVSASLPGASPATMASAVATPLEKQFSTIAGIDVMTSTSGQGSTGRSPCSSPWTGTSTPQPRTSRPPSPRPRGGCP